MEGIQHRLDCPAFKGQPFQGIKVVSTVEEGDDLIVQRVCRDCHRAELIRYRRKAEAMKPDE